MDVYARPGVETACLALQEQGADVCLLLVAAWLGRRGVSCSKERAQILENAARPWRETVIEPLRRLRCAWREAATHDACLAELREEMKAQELRAEREHLQRLADGIGEQGYHCVLLGEGADELFWGYPRHLE
ncbi:TIGR02444 family protein, partial [Pseudomonas aeruginosa]|nr:TIGR02444 family protein [Pseudomonas aeruginosa]